VDDYSPFNTQSLASSYNCDYLFVGVNPGLLYIRHIYSWQLQFNMIGPDYYNPAGSTGIWSASPPTTITNAINRIVVALNNLGTPVFP